MSLSSLQQLLQKRQSQRQQQEESNPCLQVATSQRMISNLAYCFLTNPKLTYSDWRLLHEWLAPLPYVKPADRAIYDPLMILLITKYGFKLTQTKSYFIDCHMTLQDQKELTQWIPD